MKRQENRAVLVWRGAANAGLFSSADRAYMKAPVPRPTFRLVDKAANPSKCLAALFLNFGAFLLSKLKWAGSHFKAFPP